MPSKASTTEAFVYQLLDNQDNIVRTLDGVLPGGDVQASIHTDIRTSGTITWRKTRDIDWLSHRVRILYVQDGKEWPLLTGIPAVKNEAASSTGDVLQLDLYDKTSILLDDSYGAAYSVPAGANPITEAIAAIVSTGETKVNIPPTSATLPTGIVWDPAVSKLKIVNTLLTAANHFTIDCDGMGWLRAERYTPPTDRPTAFNFGGGEPYLPAFTRNADQFAVPNRVRVTGRTDGTTEAPFAEATDERPDSPVGFPKRGFWRTHPESDIEVADLNAYAARRLVELQQVYETHDVTHPYIPGMGLNSAGYFRGRLAVVQRQRYRLAVGGLVTSTVRTVL